MANESSFASIFEDSFTDNEEDIENYVLKLKDALENFREELDSEFLQQALQDCLSSCPEDLLDEKVFQNTFPFAHNLLIEVLKEIEETLNASAERSSVEPVNQQLLVCHNLMIVWEKSGERVSKIQKTSSMNLKSLLNTVPDVVKLVFEHCRASQKQYGTLFQGATEKLTGLFRKAKTILNLFLATLDSVIVFDTDAESETELLVKVISGIGSLVTISHKLDMKTYVDTSKTFGKLATTYQHCLNRDQSINVILHIEQMTRIVSSMLSLLQVRCENLRQCQDTLKMLEISEVINTRQRNFHRAIFMDSLEKVDERKVKVISHSLRILDRLFAAYCSCLNNESLPCAIELLSQMHRCSPSCLQKSQADDKAIELISAHISRGTETLLNTVFGISDFKQAFFEYGIQPDIDTLGYHLLTISIMKKLINKPFEQHCRWTMGAESIIDLALKTIDDIQEQICIGEIRSPIAQEIGERPRQAPLYEATLVPICGLIVQIPADGFYAIELILLKHLLRYRFWSSLLSSDVWCFVGRVGSSELCVRHVKYLLKLYAELSRRYNSLEVVMLENLIGRLYSLLAEDAKHSLVMDLDDLEGPSWTPLARFLPARTKSFLQNRLARVINEIGKMCADVQRQPTAQNWNRMVTMMSFVGKLDYAGEKSTVDSVSHMWNCVANTIEMFEERQLDILSEFLSKLFDATRPDPSQDCYFSTFLKAAITSYLCFPSHVKVDASHYLRNNAVSFGNWSPSTAHGLAELYCHLLADENPWVRQEAFESFDHVAHVCPDEDLVASMAAAVTKRSSLSESLPAYLSGACYYEFRDFTNLQHYFRHVASDSRAVRHVCPRFEECERIGKVPRLETQAGEGRGFVESVVSPTNNLDESVNKTCDELNDILKKSGDISDAALRKLRIVCAKILSFTETPK